MTYTYTTCTPPLARSAADRPPLAAVAGPGNRRATRVRAAAAPAVDPTDACCRTSMATVAGPGPRYAVHATRVRATAAAAVGPATAQHGARVTHVGRRPDPARALPVVAVPNTGLADRIIAATRLHGGWRTASAHSAVRRSRRLDGALLGSGPC